VLPATQAGTATQASADALHVKAGALQAQLVSPVSVLLVLYSGVVGHVRHAEPPAASLEVENSPAGHAEHTVSDIKLEGRKSHVKEAYEPAAQMEQAAHGE